MEEVAISEAVEVGGEVEAVEAEEEQQAGLDLIDDLMELDSQIMMSKSTECFTLIMLSSNFILILFFLGQKVLVPKQSLLLKTK